MEKVPKFHYSEYFLNSDQSFLVLGLETGQQPLTPTELLVALLQLDSVLNEDAKALINGREISKSGSFLKNSC